jgi:hypothetical protein
LPVLRSRQQRLLRDVGNERRGIQAPAAAATKASHCLHELMRAAHGAGRGIGRKAAELPIYADSAQRGGSSQLIVGDVIDL